MAAWASRGPIDAARSAPVEPAGNCRVVPSGSLTEIEVGSALRSAVSSGGGISPMIGARIAGSPLKGTLRASTGPQADARAGSQVHAEQGRGRLYGLDRTIFDIDATVWGWTFP